MPFIGIQRTKPFSVRVNDWKLERCLLLQKNGNRDGTKRLCITEWLLSVKKVNVHAYEEVLDVSKQNNVFTVKTTKQLYKARNVVVATGYYDSPNYMNVPGEASEHVMHYFKEAHPFF